MAQLNLILVKSYGTVAVWIKNLGEGRLYFNLT